VGLQNEGLKMQNENMKLTTEKKQAAYKIRAKQVECIKHQEACNQSISNSDDDVMNGIPYKLFSAVQEDSSN